MNVCMNHQCMNWWMMTGCEVQVNLHTAPQIVLTFSTNVRTIWGTVIPWISLCLLLVEWSLSLICERCFSKVSMQFVMWTSWIGTKKRATNMALKIMIHYNNNNNNNTSNFYSAFHNTQRCFPTHNLKIPKSYALKITIKTNDKSK